MSTSLSYVRHTTSTRFGATTTLMGYGSCIVTLSSPCVNSSQEMTLKVSVESRRMNRSCFVSVVATMFRPNIRLVFNSKTAFCDCSLRRKLLTKY